MPTQRENPMPESVSRRPSRTSRWWWPTVTTLAVGAVVAAAFAIGGDMADGARALATFAVLAALFTIGRRSETLQGIGGAGRDERWAMIDLRATAFAGMVVITAVLGAWLFEIASGEDGAPYGQLGAIGALGYVLALGVLRWRT